jgi:L-amino acid N-acyltransferase YncA
VAISKNKEGITIRDADISDCMEIARIWSEGCMASAGIAAPSWAKSVDAFSRRLQASREHSRLWVAQASGKVIGWQGVSLFGGGTQIVPMGLSSTYVDSEWQSKGVGRTLLKHAQRESTEMGLWFLLGWIKTDNHASIKMVLSLGWTLVGSLRSLDRGRPEYAWYAYDVSAMAIPDDSGRQSQEDCPSTLGPELQFAISALCSEPEVHLP